VRSLGLTPQLLVWYSNASTISSSWFAIMRCPKCGLQDDKVIDSRASREGATIRRRRECIACGHRFTTYEEIERSGLVVLKRDDRREEFSKDKLLSGVKKACQKRPISPKIIEDLAERIVNRITDVYEREVPAEVIGKMVMDELRQLDQVAYVRFASVYRRFKEATDFVDEVRNLEEK
jgi:transcriptional repressor NrdR